ncbi:MAG: glycosyltransferase [Calditrichaceae bacterium]
MADTPYRFFSVLIPSYNRADEIFELLESFRHIDFSPDQFELIIADDGSTDRTREIVDSFTRNTAYSLKYVSQKNQGPGAARNLAVKNAKGDFFIFIDSDVTVPDSWLKNIAEIVNSENADAFGGPDTYRDDFPALLKAIDYSMTSFITTGGLRGRKGKKLAKFYPRSFNMGISPLLWDKIGGFGSLRHGQDIEFSHRIIKSGAKVVFIEDAPVYHKRRTNLRRFYRQVFNWGVARINLYKIDATMLEPLHALPAAGTFISALVLISAPFLLISRLFLVAGVFSGALILLFSMIDAARKYRSLAPVFLLPLVMPAQIYGYGLGFIYNYIRRVWFGKEEKTGFKKNYYK